MFKWLITLLVCMGQSWIGSFARSASFGWVLFALLLSQSAVVEATAYPPPAWTVPIQQTSGDGLASLAWELATGNGNEFYKVTETFKDKVTVHYTEATALQAWRVEPGEYAFVLQSCVKNKAAMPKCGSPSTPLTLLVSDALVSALINDGPADTEKATTAFNLNGGPDQLQPGHWYNPNKDGHGWSFYWSNRLALPQDDPLFGDSYDLVGIWYTYEAKYAVPDGSCSSCPPVTSAYRPVVLKLKAVSTGVDSYTGSLYASRDDGSEVWVGGADVTFGSDNSSATINWSASFKKESLSDTDPLVFLLGSDPSDTTNISHFSGLWQQSGEDRYMVVTNIGDSAEVVTVIFHDDAGDPTWIQAINNGSAFKGSSHFCLAYQMEGYSPRSAPPPGWAQAWSMSGCDPEQVASTSNRNGRRYFSGLDKQYFWADFTLPGTDYASGSISIGSSAAVVPLDKTANFHGIFFDDIAGASCELSAANTTCDLLLTWYTDGNYPYATAYRHDVSNNTYEKILTSSQAAMIDVPYQISVAGSYEFELRMGDGQQTTLMAKSDVFNVTHGATDANPEVPPAPASPPSMAPGSSSSRVGATAGSFRVDESGSATYSIPILTAPASGGVAPQISLDYNSQSGNGAVGVGWSVGGVSSISLCPQTMEQDAISGSRGIRLDGADRFCLDGQRLVAEPASGAYGQNGTRYRTEIDSFARVTSYGSAGNGPAWFKVERKDGSVAEYGNSPDSRIEARGSVNPATVFTWAQNRFEDRTGNYILYSYLENNDGPVAFVLQAIDYTGNTRAGTLPSARLSFTYRDRNTDEDLVYSYFSGVEVEQRRLLQSIRSQGRLDAHAPLEDLRFYELEYVQDGMGRSILTSLTECRSVDRSICYPPTSFGWLKSESKVDTSGTVVQGLLPGSNLSGMLLADVSGDARPDLLYTKSTKRKYYLHVNQATASGGFNEWTASYQLPKKADGSPPQVFAIDLNSDGIQDLVYSKYAKTTDDYSWVALISNGDGFSTEKELNAGHRFFLTGQKLEARFQVMDFNGDGLSDILHAHTDLPGSTWQLSVLLNITAAGGNPALSAPVELDITNTDLFPFDVAGDWGIDVRPPLFEWSAISAEEHEIPDARIFDFNGDGAVDLLLNVWRNYRHCVSNCVPQLTAGETQSRGGKVKDPVYEYRFVSFWVLMESNGQNAFTRHSVVAVGDSCDLAAICQDSKYDSLPRSDYVWPVDLNADGLADLAWGDRHGNWYFRINTGAGFTAAELIAQLPDDTNKLARFEDWNGDTYPDLIYPSGILDDNARWMINQNHFGRVFAAATNTGIPSGNVGGNADFDPVENDASIFADFTGDGKKDQLLINSDRSGEILSTTIRKGMNVSGSRAVEPANVITSITNGFGAKTEISYKPLTDTDVYTRMHDSANVDWGRGAAVYDMVAPIYVVNQVSGSAPVYGYPNASRRVQYHYVGAKLQAGGRGFLGFGEVISYDSQLKLRTNSRYRQDFPFIGLLADTTRVSNAAGSRFAPVSDTSASEPTDWEAVNGSTSFPLNVSGTPLAYVINQWRSRNTTGAAVFPYVSDSAEITHTLEGDFDRKTLAGSTLDAFGNVLNASVSLYSSEGGFFSRETTTNIFSNDETGWVIGQLVDTSVTYSRAGTPSITRSSSFAYDPVSGVLIQEVTDPGSSVLSITTDYLVDKFGNRKQTTVTGANMSARKAVERYDSLGRFVTESLNALSQVTQKVGLRDVFGNPLEVENIDGVITVSAADHMGKPFASYTETGAWNKTFQYNGHGNNCPVETIYHTVTSSGGGPVQVHCYDVLGRLSRTATKGFNNAYIYIDQYYDSSGRVSRTTEPYYAGDTPFWNVTGYDDLGRVTSLNSAGDDDITQKYDHRAANKCIEASIRTTVIINGLNQQRIELRNPKGETEAVYDDQCGLVSYDYDAVGNLKRMTGADGEFVTMTYDLAGRKTAMNDPDKGNWQYAYNALGEIIRQLDSKHQAIDFTYDVLGRIRNRRELTDVSSLTDSAITTVNRESISYSNTSPGEGKVASATYRTGEWGAVLHRNEFTYDDFGRKDLVKTEIGNEQFVQQTTYDQYGRVFQQFDATGDSHGLRYFYSNGYVSKVKEAREGLAGLVYQDIQAMDARGNVTALTLGNGVDVISDYESETGRLINRSAYDASGIELMNVDYLFDAIGSLKQRHDLSVNADLREIYEYDGLNRLKSVDLSVNAGATAQTLALDYDSSGNIVYKSDVGAYQYNGTQPHAVSSAGGSNYGYDANGNQVSGGGRSITYTVFDKPASIEKGVNRVDFHYGIGNGRYQREDYDGGVLQKSTLYLGTAERITENGSTFFKRYLGGVAIATLYPASGAQRLVYLLKDHIGSIHSVLDTSGLITATMHFSAFGERQGTDWQTPLTGFLYSPLNDITTRGFTGHEQVDSLGIIHMNGRIYDPKLGRFLQADPLIQAPKNSQSLNRYSYVLNNPLSFTDPSGFFSLKRFFKKWGRLIVAAVVSYVTYGAASGWATTWLAGTSLAGNAVAIGTIAGAISGFAGGAIIAGTIKGAVTGAFSGAIMGGVAGHFGNTYSVKRIATDSLASGVSSEIYGGKFKDGLLFGALISSATYINVRLRQYEYDHSDGTPGQIGESPGHRGISGKIGGARFEQDIWRETGQVILENGGTVKDAFDSYVAGFNDLGRKASPLGCHQGGPGCVFGNSYKPGSVFDYIVEGFAGTHDYLNHPVYYNPDGTSKTLIGISRRYGQFRNVTNVFLAAPIVLPSLIPDQLRHLALTEFD